MSREPEYLPSFTSSLGGEERSGVGREVREPVAGTQFTSRNYVTGPGSAMVAEWDAESAIRLGYYSNIFLYACVRALAEDVAALCFRAGADPDKPDEYDDTSPLARLLGSPPLGPNRYTTGRQLIAWSIAQLLVTGRFGWEMAYPKGSRAKNAPDSLWPLTAAKLEPVVSQQPGRYFDGFVFNRGSGREVQLKEEQVLYYWRPAMHDWRQPESAIQAARLDVSVMVMQDRYDYAFLRNDARPAAVVVHQAFAEPGAKEAFRQQFLGAHAGPDNAGRMAFVETSDDGATPKESLVIQQIGLSQRDAQFIERYDRKLRAIVVALGVPLSRLGDSSDRTYSNAGTEYEIYLRDRVKPLAREFQDAINLQLAPRVGSELGWFDLGPLDSAISQARVLTAGIPDLVKTRVIKINEGRHALGLHSVEDGDRFLTDVELGLLQNGAMALVVPGKSGGQDPYELGAEPGDLETAETTSASGGNLPPGTVADPAPPAGKGGGFGANDPGTTPPLPDTGPSVRAADRRTTSRTARETRRLRAYAAMDKRVRGHEASFEAAFQSLLDRQRSAVVARLTGKRGRQMLRVGAEGRAATSLDPSAVFDYEAWSADTVATFEPLYESLTGDAAKQLASQLGLDLRLPSRWAKKFISTRANQLAGNVTDATYAAIKDELVSGVAGGETVAQLAARIEDLFAQTYANRARTVARTEVISAYNGASLAVAEASPVGLDTQEWLATPGTRTRDSHAEADGQQVPVGEMFDVGGVQLAYPGDPSGPAEEVVNCRCTVLLIPSDPSLDAVVSAPPADAEE